MSKLQFEGGGEATGASGSEDGGGVGVEDCGEDGEAVGGEEGGGDEGKPLIGVLSSNDISHRRARSRETKRGSNWRGESQTTRNVPPADRLSAFHQRC